MVFDVPNSSGEVHEPKTDKGSERSTNQQIFKQIVNDRPLILKRVSHRNAGRWLQVLHGREQVIQLCGFRDDLWPAAEEWMHDKVMKFASGELSKAQWQLDKKEWLVDRLRTPKKALKNCEPDVSGDPESAEKVLAPKGKPNAKCKGKAKSAPQAKKSSPKRKANAQPKKQSKKAAKVVSDSDDDDDEGDQKRIGDHCTDGASDEEEEENGEEEEDEETLPAAKPTASGGAKLKKGKPACSLPKRPAATPKANALGVASAPPPKAAPTRENSESARLASSPRYRPEPMPEFSWFGIL
jgi:hypothetical protein